MNEPTQRRRQANPLAVRTRTDFTHHRIVDPLYLDKAHEYHRSPIIKNVMLHLPLKFGLSEAVIILYIKS